MSTLVLNPVTGKLDLVSSELATPVSIANGGTNNSTAYTAGSVLFSDGSKVTEHNAGLYWNDSLMYFSIGSTNPLAPIQASAAGVYGQEIPTMISNSIPAPYVAAASSEASSGNQAWGAFSQTSGVTEKWASNATNTGWLRMDFGSGRTPIITRYAITGPISGDTTYAPKTWTFEGSNDASSWTVLDTQTNAAAWSALEKRTFSFTNTTAYRYYRVNISVNQGGGYCEITNLDMMSGNVPTLRASQTLLEVGGPIFLLVNSTDLSYGLGSTATTNLRINSSTTSKVTTTAPELVMEQTGDALGTTRMHMQNRSGSAGALFENAGLDLVDFGFKPLTGPQSNFRLEHRAAALKASGNSLGEFQFLMDSTSTAVYSLVTGAAVTDVFTGKFGVNQAAPGAMGHFVASSSSTIVGIDQGAASQSADLREWLDSSSNVLAKVNSKGNISQAIGSTTSLMTGIGVADVQTSSSGVGNTADTNDDTLFTYSLPSNSMSANGKSVRVRAAGSSAANANTKDIKLWFAGTTIVDSGVLALNNADWSIEMEITRIDSTHVSCVGTWTDNGLSAATVKVTANLVVSDLTANASVIKVTGASTVVGAANDVKGYLQKTWFEN